MDDDSMRFDYQRQLEEDRRKWEEYEAHCKRWREIWKAWSELPVTREKETKRAA